MSVDATRIAECIVATAEREIDTIVAGLEPDTDDDEFERALDDAHGSIKHAILRVLEECVRTITRELRRQGYRHELSDDEFRQLMTQIHVALARMEQSGTVLFLRTQLPGAPN